MELLATGDAIVTRPLVDTDPGFQEIQALFERADVGFTNLEMALPELPAMPAALLKGSHLAGDRGAVGDLARLGVTVCNVANNHATDYCTSGLEDSLALLEREGMPFAGAGRSLGAARAPAYVDGSAGRCAVIGVSSSNASTSLAADPGPFTRGRPGINPLRYATTYEVTAEQLRLLRDLDEQLGTAAARRGRVTTSRSRAVGSTGAAQPDSLPFADRLFRAAGSPRVATTAHAGDLGATCRSVELARATADVVVVSVHCHEGAADGWNSPHVPDFLTESAHAWIDAGADAVIGHGPHQLRGVEIYDGKPILYSLGNFFFTNATVPFLPPDAYEAQGLDPYGSSVVHYADAAVGGGFPAHEQYWRAMVAQLVFDDGRVGARLLPITLGQRESRWRRGVPALAEGEEAQRTLRVGSDLSEPFFTRVTIEAGGAPTGRPVGRPIAVEPSR